MRTPPPDVIKAAQAAQASYGILASVQLAQWAQESGWGAKVTGTFNFFGVKGVAGPGSTLCWTHEVVNGARQLVQAPFRNFSSLEEAFGYHAMLLATGSPYRPAWPLRGDYRAYVQAIGPHYATDPNYAAELITLIEEEGFTQYDLPAPPANDDALALSKLAVGQS